MKRRNVFREARLEANCGLKPGVSEAMTDLSIAMQDTWGAITKELTATAEKINRAFTGGSAQ